MKYEQVLQVRKWGNSAGVLLPKELMNMQVKVLLIDRTGEIKKDVLNILSDYLNDIIGIYLVGSYARREQNADSDIDIIAISGKTSKKISSGRYNIEIYQINNVENALESNPIMILPRLMEAKSILNLPLLNELRMTKINKNQFKDYLFACKRVLKISRDFMRLDQEIGYKKLDPKGVIYPLVLRLRGIYLIEILLKNLTYQKKSFLNWISTGAEISLGETENIYNIYCKEKDGKVVKDTISYEIGFKLVKFMEREIKQYEKREKA
ncbi:MAG: nucleotidyltransferase domain-containing protein [Nanoarchaeota archaeon]